MLFLLFNRHFRDMAQSLTMYFYQSCGRVWFKQHRHVLYFLGSVSISFIKFMHFRRETCTIRIIVIWSLIWNQCLLVITWNATICRNLLLSILIKNESCLNIFWQKCANFFSKKIWHFSGWLPVALIQIYLFFLLKIFCAHISDNYKTFMKKIIPTKMFFCTSQTKT